MTSWNRNIVFCASLFLAGLSFSSSFAEPSPTEPTQSLPTNKEEVRRQKWLEKKERLKSEKFLYKHDSGTFYLRVGGGISIPGEDIFKSNSSTIFSLLDPNSNNVEVTPQQTAYGSITGMMNLAVGFNFYSKRAFHFGMEISTDLNFAPRQSLSYPAFIYENGFTKELFSMLVELKFRFGVDIKCGVERVVPYIVLGVATEILNGDAYGYDKNTDTFYRDTNVKPIHALFGPTYGLGVMVNSRKYPIGFYAEFTVPTILTMTQGKLTIDVSDSTGSSVGSATINFSSGLSVIFAPRFAAGIQVGF